MIFNTTSVRLDGESKTLSLGLLGHVFTFDKKMLREKLEEATKVKEESASEKEAANQSAKELKQLQKEQKKREKELEKEKKRQEKEAKKEQKRLENRQKANEKYRALICEFLSLADGGKTCTEIAHGVDELNDFNNQKVAALMRQLVESGAVTKATVKGKSLFSLA